MALPKLPLKPKAVGFTGLAWAAKKVEGNWYSRVDLDIEDGMVVKETVWPPNEKCVIVNEIEAEVANYVTGGPRG